jgi:hypothetical protein
MKIPEFKRSGIGLIAEFRGIPNGFPNQGRADILFSDVILLFVSTNYLTGLDLAISLFLNKDMRFNEIQRYAPSELWSTHANAWACRSSANGVASF